MKRALAKGAPTQIKIYHASFSDKPRQLVPQRGRQSGFA